MKAIGIKILIQNYDADTFFGTNLPTGNFEIAEFAWVSTPFLSGNESIYCSYTNTTECADNWDHYANSTVDTDVFNGAGATDSRHGDRRLQRCGQAAVGRHGHPAALPEAAVLRMDQHLRERRPERLLNRSSVERQPVGNEDVVTKP